MMYIDMDIDNNLGAMVKLNYILPVRLGDGDG